MWKSVDFHKTNIMEDSISIDLGEFLPKDSKVLTRKAEGIHARFASYVDIYEELYSKIVIIVPNTVSSANPSFLEAFLTGVVQKLGEKEFYKKFTFESQGSYCIDDDLYEAVDRILREAGMK